MGRIHRIGRVLGHAIGQIFFLAVSLSVVIAGLGLLRGQLGADTPNAGLISAAGALVLFGALFARYGEHLAARIKRVGPVELFEEIRETLSSLEEIATAVPEIVISEERIINLQPVILLPKERFSFEQGDLYASMLMAMGKEPTQPELRSKYFRLLFKVGACAFGLNDWPRVVARLGRLEELSGGSFRHEDVAHYLGAAYCYWGMKTTHPEERQSYFAAAKVRLLGLAGDGDSRHRTYFFLAYAQDELGYWYEAVSSNAEALKRRPRFAPAKYNGAISRLKLGACKDAFQVLETLDPGDEEIDGILAWYDKDGELLPQMEDQWRRATEGLMRDIRRRRELREEGLL